MPGPASGRPSTRRILELIRAHRSTIVFTNSRRLAERLAQRLNELAGEELVRAHHGSIAREQRVAIEEELKAGRLPALVATSTLELGIDMGAVDLVIQVESPTSVARGLQRIGRAGHQVGEPSKGVIFPKYRGDLLETAVVVKRHARGRDRDDDPAAQPARRPRPAARRDDGHGPLDRGRAARRSSGAPPRTRRSPARCSRACSACSPAPTRRDEFAELKPRVVWDRVTDVVEGRRDARVVAVTSGGTIPDRGLYGVFIDGRGRHAGPTGRRAGRGDGLRVRAGCRRRHRPRRQQPGGSRRSRHDRVTVTPGAGRARQAAVLARRRRRAADRAGPGDRRVRPRAGGGPRAGAEGAGRRPPSASGATTTSTTCAAENLLAYLEDEREATGVLPTDRRIVVERFRDELGDWRLVPADPVRRPGPRAVVRWRSRRGSGSGSASRSRRSGPTTGSRSACRRATAASTASRRCCSRTPRRSRTSSSDRSATSSAVRQPVPRERGPGPAPAAPPARAPARRSGSSASARRTCWRWPAATAASRSSSRPTASASRTCSTCRRCARSSAASPRREIAVHSVETARASAFASIAAVRLRRRLHVRRRRAAGRAARAGAHARPRPAARAARPGGAARAARPRRAGRPRAQPPGAGRGAAGDDRSTRSTTCCAASATSPRTRSVRGPRVVASRRRSTWLALAGSRRAVRVRIAGEERWIAIEDVARYRDGVGRAGAGRGAGRVPGAGDRGAGRAARALGADARAVPDARSRRGAGGCPAGVVEDALERLLAAGSLLRGEFRPGGAEREWCDPEVLRLLRRRSLARLRREVEPVDPVDAGAVPARLARRRPRRRVPAAPGAAVTVPWLGGPRAPGRGRRPARGPADPGVRAGAGRPAGADPRATSRGCSTSSARWARSPGWGGGASAATTAGSCSTGPGGSCCGRPARRTASSGRPARSTRQHPRPPPPPGRLASTGSCSRLRARRSDREVLDALWDLVWAGEVTNDTFAPLRALRWKRPGEGPRGRGPAG